VEAAEGAEEEEGTTRATSSSRATAPEAATAASPMRVAEEVAEEVDTTVKVSRTIPPSSDTVQWTASKLLLHTNTAFTLHTLQMPEEEEEEVEDTKGVTEAEEGSRVDVEASKEEGGAGAGEDLALSPSTKTWGRSRPSCSSCRAQRVLFLMYVTSLPFPFLS
jgi:hypothetical protein